MRTPLVCLFVAGLLIVASATPAPAAEAVEVRRNVRIVCTIHADRWADGMGHGLWEVERLLRYYQAMDVPREEIHLVVVVYGDAAYWLLDHDAYRRSTGKDLPNPNARVVSRLIAGGARVDICEATMKRHGWTADDLVEGVSPVVVAEARLADLQLQGYACLRF